MGLVVYVYRNGLGDCTLNGISSNADRLCLVNVEGPSEPRDDCPAAYLVKGAMPGICRIVPAGENGQPEKRWTMFGGNYAANSDSRLSAAIEAITGSRFYGAVAIHDRIEP